LKKEKLGVTQDLDELKFEHDRLKRAKENFEQDLSDVDARLKKRESELDELRAKTDVELEELRAKSKVSADEKVDAEIKLGKIEREMEAMGEELASLKTQAKEQTELATDSELKIAKFEREVEKLTEEIAELSQQNKDYIMKVKEAEMQTAAGDNILQIQLDKAHTKIAELKEEVEDLKLKDSTIAKMELQMSDMQTERSLENNNKQALQQELEATEKELSDLKHLAEQFKSSTQGQLAEEVMLLKRQIDVGKEKVAELIEENIWLKTRDRNLTVGHREPSFIATSADEQMFKNASKLDAESQKEMLGAMKMQFRKLSTQNPSPTSVGPRSVGDGFNRTDTAESVDLPDSMDDLSMADSANFDDDGPPLLDRSNTVQSTASSTMDPGWDFSGTAIFGGDEDAPLPTGPPT